MPLVFVPAFTFTAVSSRPLSKKSDYFRLIRFPYQDIFLILPFIDQEYINLILFLSINSSGLILFLIGQVISEISAYHSHPSLSAYFYFCLLLNSEALDSQKVCHRNFFFQRHTVVW